MAQDKGVWIIGGIRMVGYTLDEAIRESERIFGKTKTMDIKKVEPNKLDKIIMELPPKESWD